jgi:hypothetical protein
MRELHQKGLSWASLRHATVTLRHLMKHGEELGAIAAVPILRPPANKLVARDQAPRRAFSEGERDRVLRAMRANGDHRAARVWTAMAYSGLRRGELARLTLRSLDLRAKVLHVFGKSGQHETVPLHQEVQRAVRLEAAARGIKAADVPVFGGFDLRKAWKRALKRAKVDAHGTTAHHTARHTFGTLLAQHSHGDVTAVQAGGRLAVARDGAAVRARKRGQGARGDKKALRSVFGANAPHFAAQEPPRPRSVGHWGNTGQNTPSPRRVVPRRPSEPDRRYRGTRVLLIRGSLVRTQLGEPNPGFTGSVGQNWGTIHVTIVGLLALRPKLTVSLGPPIGARPFSLPFLVKNDSLYSLSDVRVTCFLRSVEMPGIIALKNIVEARNWYATELLAGRSQTVICPIELVGATKAEVVLVVGYRPLSFWRKRTYFRFIGRAADRWSWLERSTDEVEKEVDEQLARRTDDVGSKQ